MKILISDVDKTLYFSTEEPPIRDFDRKKVEEFQKAGHLFGICTGRSFSGVKELIEDYGLKFDFMILSSGAIIIDQNFNYIKHITLKRDEIQKLIEDTKDKVIRFSLTNTDNIFFYSGKRRFEPSETVLNFNEFNEVFGNEFESFSLKFNNVENLKKVSKLLDEKYCNIFTHHQNVDSLDISPLGCSKGNAIKELQAFFNINENDVNAIGDSFNDISMFNAVKHSYTFNNSDFKVQKEAKKLVDSIGECITNILKNN